MCPTQSKPMPPPLDRFDELSAVIRVVLFLKKHPKSNISTIINNVTAGQRAVYSAKKYLQDNNLLEIETKTTLPYNDIYSLNTRGQKIGEYLEEMQKILEH
jgi:predicted transcriptional regulator